MSCCCRVSLNSSNFSSLIVSQKILFGGFQFEGDVGGTVVTGGAKVGRFSVRDEVKTVGDPVVKSELFVFPVKGYPGGVVGVGKEGGWCFQIEAVEEVVWLGAFVIVSVEAMSAYTGTFFGGRA